MANKPNNPELWSRAKSLAKQKFDVYPSAYANGWAAKWYKSKGGTWRKAKYGMEIPFMASGGKTPPNNEGFLALPSYVQQKIIDNMAMGGQKMPIEIARARFAAAGNLDKLDDYGYAEQGGYMPIPIPGNFFQQSMKPRYMMMDQGGEADGGMALGQIGAVVDKMSKVAQMIKPNSDLAPWLSSKLAVMDHYADAVSDYMIYGAEGDEEGYEKEEDDEYKEDEYEEEEEGSEMTENEVQIMKMGGGIPQRYKNMGFTKVGVKRQSNRPGKKWMVLAKKGDQYKVVHGGYKGMKDFTQHGSEKRKKRFWDRMGGKNSAKAKNPFSPLYWHKRFGTW